MHIKNSVLRYTFTKSTGVKVSRYKSAHLCVMAICFADKKNICLLKGGCIICVQYFVRALFALSYMVTPDYSLIDTLLLSEQMNLFLRKCWINSKGWHCSPFLVIADTILISSRSFRSWFLWYLKNCIISIILHKSKQNYHSFLTNYEWK